MRFPKREVKKQDPNVKSEGIKAAEIAEALAEEEEDNMDDL